MIPWLPKKKIARAAAKLLDDYACVVQDVVHPPIPVENIIERGLKLRLGFVDLRTALEMDDVLGATYIKQRRICVDKSLLDGPSEGRLLSTQILRCLI